MPFLDHVLRGRHVPPERQARGRPPLRALRRREPDQRPEPGAPRGAPRGARRARPAPAALLGQPELASVPRRRAPGDGGRRRQAARSRSSPRRIARTRGAASTSRTSRARGPRSGRARRWSTSCASSTITRGSSRPTPTVCAMRSPRCRRPAARRRGIAFTAHSIPAAMAAGSDYVAQLRRDVRPGGGGGRRASAGRSSTRAGAARLSSRGSSRTSSTTSTPSRPRASRTSSWRRSASCPTTWRSSTTLTPRPASAPPRSASASCEPGRRGPTRPSCG